MSDPLSERTAAEDGQGAPWLEASIPDRTRLVSLPFGRVFVCDVGSSETGRNIRPPLVLLHGLFVTHHSFHRLIPRIAAGRRIIALDLPGAGDSDRPPPRTVDGYSLPWMADAVLQTLRAMEVERFDLLGHDFGGTVALTLAASHPGAVGALTLLSPLALTVSLPLQGSLAVMPSLGAEVFTRTLRRADLKGFLQQGASTPELVDEGDVHVFWDRLSRFGGREAAYAMLGQLPSVVRLRGQFSKVEAPCSLLWGDRDELVPPSHAERLAALLPHATLELIDGCGHNPAAERPNAVAALLK